MRRLPIQTVDSPIWMLDAYEKYLKNKAHIGKLPEYKLFDRWVLIIICTANCFPKMPLRDLYHDNSSQLIFV